MSILIADDDATSLRLLQKMLGKMSYSVNVASDGMEAWDKYRELKPRIVISDWLMPNMNGLELCRKIRSRSTENYTYIQ